MKKNIQYTVIAWLGFMVLLVACQKMDRPQLPANFPTDDHQTLEPGPLRFYIPFNDSIAGKTARWWVYDSISKNPALINPLKSIPGVSGLAMQGEKDKEIKYLNSNDFTSSSSFAVAFWLKGNTPPATEAQFIFSIPSTAGHWSNATMFLFVDHAGAGTTKDAAVLKFLVFDKKGENWFELTNQKRLTQLFDNSWHHLAFSYDEASSEMSVYKDGVLQTTLPWTGHGKIEMEPAKVTGFKLLGKTTDWGEAWQGGLDQFRLYNKPLSATDVKTLFTSKE